MNAAKPKTTYLRQVYDTDLFQRTMREVLVLVRNIRHSFDAIAFRGHSGAAVAYPLSYALNIPLLCVRKPGNTKHYIRETEGHVDAGRYLIVDDFVDSGETIRKILQVLPYGSCKGLLLYKSKFTWRNTAEEGFRDKFPVYKVYVDPFPYVPESTIEHARKRVGL